MDVPSAIEIENAEVYGATVGQDVESRSERNIEYSKHNYNRGMAQIDKNALISDNIVFEDALGKFQKISEEQIDSQNQLKKSK